MTEYVTGASTLQAAFSLDGSNIIACWDYDCGVVLLDVDSGKVGGNCCIRWFVLLVLQVLLLGASGCRRCRRVQAHKCEGAILPLTQVLRDETFESIREGRSKSSYVISPAGDLVGRGGMK